MDVTTRIAIPPGGAYFEGHFPGRPILPGVTEIALVLEALTRERHGGDRALREIAYTRLRQVVLPGDHLELTARTVASGRVRIELKRAGTLVANGEWLLGAIEPADEVAPAGTTTTVPLHEVPPLDALLPHRPPMRFIQSILAETADSLSCAAAIPSACALVNAGTAPAVAGLEAAAQAAAAWEALQRQRAGGMAVPRVGYLVALRDVVFFAGRIPAGQTLFVSVRLEAAAAPLSHYQAELRFGDKLLLRGMIATYLKEDGD